MPEAPEMQVVAEFLDSNLPGKTTLDAKVLKAQRRPVPLRRSG